MAIEEPKYNVTDQETPFEIRKYELRCAVSIKYTSEAEDNMRKII